MSAIIEEKASGMVAVKGEYLAPEIKAINVKCRQVVCGSYDSAPATMDWGNEQTDSNWN